jgi:prepilin-type N-terminal cleavage/methylation domain-containing protein
MRFGGVQVLRIAAAFPRRKIRSAFTLIELLIVVAIIAILAAIAVPNFLEAQTRAKVARVASDLRTYTTAMETYRIDHNKPPPTYRANAAQTRKWIAHFLTTPIAYMTTALPDVFNTNVGYSQNSNNPDNMYIIAWGPDHYLQPSNLASYPSFFQNYPLYSDGSAWKRKDFVYVFSMGPDKAYDILDGKAPRAVFTYDPTNGTISRGEVGRFNG